MLVNKYSLWGVIIGGVVSIIALTFMLWWMFFRVSYVVYSQDTTIQGNLVVTEDQPILLKNNAKLTITGDAIVAGNIVCDDGGIQLDVQGFLTITETVECETDPQEYGAEASGVTLVSASGLFLAPTSEIISEGSVQITDAENKVARSQADVDRLFASITEEAPTGIQVGPLSNDDDAQSFSAPSGVSDRSVSKALPFVQVASAAEPEGGRANIGMIADRLDQADLTPSEEKEVYAFMLYWSYIAGIREISKNDPTFIDAQRLLREKELDELKAEYLDLNLTPQEIDEIASIIDFMILEEMFDTSKLAIIGGKITIGNGGKPPEEIDVDELLENEIADLQPDKIVLNFDFSDGKAALLNNLTIKGPNGSDAQSGFSTACSVIAPNGGDALRFNARAGNLRVGDFTIELGSGGNGGTIATGDNCDTASAQGGDGGKPGDIRMYASNSFEITGTFSIIPGYGGNGGFAKATTIPAKAACPGEIAGDATAVAGNGGDSMQKLRIRGTIGGVANIQIGAAHGGNGGTAFAEANHGGDGEFCGCNGGFGGDAFATGGNGGNAAPSQNGLSTGGDGGDAIAQGGDGGFGGSCRTDEGPAGDGGDGGLGQANVGLGGTGDIAGRDGGLLSEALAGDGGNGGDGCPEGLGGEPGDDATSVAGEDGKRFCTTPPPPPPPEDETIIDIKGVDPESMYEMEVIPYSGAAIPTFLVRVAGPDACDSDHWHGGGTITMIDGSTTSDPATNGCGFGKRSELEPIKVRVNEARMNELYGSSVGQYLFYNDPSQDQANSGCTMVRLCMTGGSWVTCPGQEDIIAKNTELGCPGY